MRFTTGGQEGDGNDNREGVMGQEIVPDDSLADVSVHRFWKCGTSAIFDMQMVNSDVGSYLRQTSAKALAMAEKEKKDKHLQPCLECRCTLTPRVYSTYVIHGTEDVSTHRRLASLISNNKNQEY